MTLFEVIKQRREQMFLSQRDIATALSVDVPMYSRYERGIRPIREELLPLLASILNLEYNKLRNLWLADKVYSVINEESNAKEILNIVSSNLTKSRL